MDSSAGREASFGVLLRSLRLAAGLTQEELAEMAGLSDRAIRRLEADPERRPQLQTVRLLAQALGLSEMERSRLLAAARPAERRDSAPTALSLPLTLTPLLGREDDVALIVLLLQERRLVTLCGAGGVGKTRLAVEIGRRMAGAFGRITFVELASLRDPDDMLGAVAAALALRPQRGASLLEVVAGALRAGRALLILDNFEHLLAASLQVLDLLAACPELSTLVTSREALHVRGERVYTLAPLPLPDREADIPRSPAVRLFLERAADAGMAVEPDAAGLSAAAEICRRLDGLPLAIELAAAWTPLLSLPALLAGLATRLPYLERGPRDAPARQRTMRNAIAWSFDLLSSDEQTLFARCGVFAGDWSLQAAEAVCAPNRSPDVPEGLSRLVDKSLVQQQDELRFSMHETVRQCAIEKLRERGEAEAIAAAHARHFLHLARQAAPELLGPRQGEWFSRLEAEHDNLREALRALLAVEQVDDELQLAVDLYQFWFDRGFWQEGSRWLESGLARTVGTAGTTRVQALGRAGHFLALRGELERGLDLLQEALTLAQECGDPKERAWLLANIGHVLYDRGEVDQARRRFQESLSLAHEAGDLEGVAFALDLLGGMAVESSQFVEAEARFREALALWREIGTPSRLAIALNNTGWALVEQEKYVEALPLLEESLALLHALGMKEGLAATLDSLACVVRAQGNGDRARALLEEGLAVSGEMGDKDNVLLLLGRLAELEAEQGRAKRATRLAGAEAAARDSTGLHKPPVEQERRDRAMEQTRTSLGPAAFRRAWEEGRAMTLEAAIAYALDRDAK